ncbi:phage terminase small subunit P27 family [Sinorhizobium prairiense]|uniref:phage terminase small subunit P27 family n=1 Tax=unclassified Sinorhizobium TaxID=2613772 RepID=UPI0023D8A26B|nr:MULTISPECIES: phage terminase small subunit P27 family [unclassified Sinorhizobium]WEJ11177.1 phage terminase small subunit P27 family [Sinorhizobium sp. M103]WEJ14223.1 phage terminase small subunit P27 family [Sinorhizobium sp. K101]WEJ38161.1 phage terminase small subunit P27 family [Sinorhizobium sp. C101]
MTHLRGVKPSLTPDRAPLTKAPSAPKWMTDEARAEWKRIMPRLIEDRIITNADLTGVENYCVAVGRVREIEALFRTSGTLDKVLFGMQNRAMQTARQLAAEYGLSPVSRARVGGAATDDDDDDNPMTIGRNRAYA